MIDATTAITIGLTAAISAAAGALVRGVFHERSEALEALLKEKVLKIVASSPFAQDLVDVAREVRDLREDLKACRLRREELARVREILKERTGSLS